MDHFTESERRLVTAMATTARGPRQNGVFALWLAIRLCDGLLPPHAPKERQQRERVTNVRRRLSSLSVPAPLRRALTAAFRDLDTTDMPSVAVTLQQLVAPARETLGQDVGEAMAVAARQARTALQEASEVTV